MKVYMAIPFEDYHGHDAYCARAFSTREAAEAYAAQRQEGENLLEWDVIEYEMDVE